jgi:hypothetical protein
MDNTIITKLNTPTTIRATTVTNSHNTNNNIHNTTHNNATTTNNATNNNTTNNTTTNNYHTTNVFNIRPYGREDLSHITDQQWQAIARMGSRDNMEEAISSLVSLINYNPSKPENMNVYMPSNTTDDALVLQRFDGNPTPRWRQVKTETVLAWLTSDRTSNAFEWISENTEMVDPDDANGVERFFDSIHNGEITQPMADLVRQTANRGSRVMLILRGGTPPTQGGSS